MEQFLCEQDSKNWDPWPRFENEFYLHDLIQNDLIQNDLIQNDLIQNDLIQNDLIQNDLIQNDWFFIFHNFVFIFHDFVFIFHDFKKGKLNDEKWKNMKNEETWK